LPPTPPDAKDSATLVGPADLKWGTAGLSIAPAVFQKFQQLIHEETGIWLGESKVALLCGRLSKRLRELGVTSLARYYELVAHADQHEERAAMINAITTNETRFFREPRQFEFLETRAIPRWVAQAEQGVRSKTIRVWSAGCSSGEEPYSLAMMLARYLPDEQGWNATLLATDISSRVIAQARVGIYSIGKSAEIPESFLKDFMLKGIGEQHGRMKVSPGIRAMVDFRELNLFSDPYPPIEHFNAIFCRNVLIYFDLESKRKVVERLTRCLCGDGLLFVGQAENLSGIHVALRSLAPAVYVKAGEGIGY
jgi:chemotaxis protein methyltransferase CheR